MKFTKYNNPNKKRHYKKISRTDADIIAGKNAFNDRLRGIDLPPDYYDKQSDNLCGQPSRHIYN